MILTNFLFLKELFRDGLKIGHLSLGVVRMKLCGQVQFVTGDVAKLQSANIANDLFHNSAGLLDFVLLV